MVAEEKKLNTFWAGWNKNTILLSASILIAAILVSGALVATRQGGGEALIGSSIKAGDLVENDAILGDKNAKVTVVEFSDFQCPFCRQFWAQTFPQLKKDYIDAGKVKFVYRDFPLSSIHPSAEISAEATQCANDQGKYWEMNNKIFGEEEKLGTGTVQFGVSDLKKWAGQIGLDVNNFNSCLDSGKYKSEVAKDLADGQAAGVEGTPTFFINGKALVGALPYTDFKQAIDVALK